MAPRDPREIEGVLRDQNSGLREKIVRNLGDFTVALLAISEYPERLALAGTGTLLSADGAHFILTARHVWEEVLKDAAHIGITLKPDVSHKFGIRRRDVAVFGLPKPDAWNEWGPDLALLRIPAEDVGSIGVYRVFLNVTKQPRRIDGQFLEVQVLMGTPAAFGKITDAHADLQISGMFLGPEIQHERNGFDYLDYEFDLTFPGVPRRFGGVSGGGVWRVYMYYSPETGEIDWSISLHGVAYFELPIVEERRYVRCHGPQGIRAVIGAVTSPILR
jgi:hypothetical protein